MSQAYQSTINYYMVLSIPDQLGLIINILQVSPISLCINVTYS